MAMLTRDEEGAAEWQKISSDGDCQKSSHFGCGGTDGVAMFWLAIFCITGVGIGMCFELLEIHAGPASASTMFLCFLGYWAQCLVSGFWTLRAGTLWQGQWTRRMVAALIASALCDGAAQGFNYVGMVEGGFMLFTIFHSSVTFFSCVIAVFVLRTRLTCLQWLSVLLVVAGLLVTCIPNPIVARESFSIGVLCSALGSLCLAASYPLSELVFSLADADPPSEESSCFCGSLVNVIAYTAWTLVYTVPNWNESIYEPIYSASNPSVTWAWIGYALFAVTVGLHSLSFWKTVHKLGTVPTAVSKGAQQAGCFVFAHILFCRIDHKECMDYNYGRSLWNTLQKPAAFTLCCVGVVLYSLGKATKAPQTAVAAGGEE